MSHAPQLVIDLALILGAAGVTTLLFKKLGQPVVLGYILAGLLVGPNFPLFLTVGEISSIKIWAEIGVIFLLFNLGLEFSFKKLLKVGSTAAVTGLFEVTLMLLCGYLAGQSLGWSHIDSLFLGGIISISSTTIIIRAFEELGLKSQKFASVVLGILVIEDLVAVVLMVLLSTLAISQQFSGVEMLTSIAKLVFFLILWFVGGIFIFPTFMRRAKRLMNEETLLVTSIAFCLLMVIFATEVGFSPALGAFIMGSILAETTQAERIEHVLKPVKELFGAIFFVSVGMLIDPNVLLEYALPLGILVLIVLFGKTLFVTIGALISGQALRTSVQAGMSLAQIGEFSFIIASLGLALNVTSDFLYPIAVGVSVITTFTTPYSIKASTALYNWLKDNLPPRWYNFLNKYSSSTEHISTNSHWREVLQDYLQTILINSVILIGMVLAASKGLYPMMKPRVPSEFVGAVLTCLLTLMAMVPFLWALIFKRSHRSSYKALWVDRTYNRSPLIFLELLRVVLAIAYVSALIGAFFTTKVAFTVAALFLVLAFALFYRRLQGFYARLEARFIQNLNAREVASQENKTFLPPWDAHLAFFDIHPNCQLVGRPLKQLRLRERFGINVVMIARGGKRIILPGPNEVLYPYDQIEVIGTDDQLQLFRQMVEASMASDELDSLPKDSLIVLEKVEVQLHHAFVNIPLIETNIRQATNGLVVGIERGTKRLLNPSSQECLRPGDILWIAGEKDKIRSFFGK